MVDGQTAMEHAARIVLADHDETARRATHDLIRGEKSIRVEEASNSDGLLALLDAGDIDCVIVDQQLGSDNGFAIHERVADRYTDPPALIMLTATGSEQAVIKALRCGFADYLRWEGLTTRALTTSILRAAETRRAEMRRAGELEYLSKLALRDRVTGLPNRPFLEERLELLTASGRRHRKKVALLLIRVNELDEVNDTFGHAVGDALLQAFSHRLKQVARASDGFGRLGGDTFLYLIDNDVTPETTELASRRLVGALSFQIELETIGLSLSCSIGSAIYPIDGQGAVELLEVGTRALDRARLSTSAYAFAPASQHLLDRSATRAATALGGGHPSAIMQAAAGLSVLDEAMLVAQRAPLEREQEARRAAGQPSLDLFDGLPANSDFPLEEATNADPGEGVPGLHRAENRRSERRQRVLKQGVIVINDGYSTITCTIRDISAHGARILVESDYSAHPNFVLMVVETGQRFPAARRWQRGREIGVMFGAQPAEPVSS